MSKESHWQGEPVVCCKLLWGKIQVFAIRFLFILMLPFFTLASITFVAALLFSVGTGFSKLDIGLFPENFYLLNVHICTNLILLPWSASLAFAEFRQLKQGGEAGADRVVAPGVKVFKRRATELAMATVVFSIPFNVAVTKLNWTGSAIGLLEASLTREWRLFLVIFLIFPALYAAVTNRNGTTKRLIGLVLESRPLRMILIMTWPAALFGLIYFIVLAIGWALFPRDMGATIVSLTPFARLGFFVSLINLVPALFHLWRR